MHIGKEPRQCQNQMNGQTLNIVQKEKDLRVILRNNLKESAQCQQAGSKALEILGIINRTIIYRHTDILLQWPRCYTGPYLVVRAIPPVNFVLQKRRKSKPFTVHADKTKKCHSPTTGSWIGIGASDESSEEANGRSQSIPLALVAISLPFVSDPSKNVAGQSSHNLPEGEPDPRETRFGQRRCGRHVRFNEYYM